MNIQKLIGAELQNLLKLFEAIVDGRLQRVLMPQAKSVIGEKVIY